jgi:hypothetical protein
MRSDRIILVLAAIGSTPAPTTTPAPTLTATLGSAFTAASVAASDPASGSQAIERMSKPLGANGVPQSCETPEPRHDGHLQQWSDAWLLHVHQQLWTDLDVLQSGPDQRAQLRRIGVHVLLRRRRTRATATKPTAHANVTSQATIAPLFTT